MSALREGGKKIAVVKKNVAKVTPPSSQGSGNIQEDSMKTAQLPTASMIPISIHPDGGNPDSTVVVTCFKSMTWVIENKNSTTAGKVAVINLKLQDYGKNPAGEKEVQFRLTRVTLEPMLRSMTYISQQLSAPANRVAVINLKPKCSMDIIVVSQLQDTKTTSGETEVKFQVSKDTLGSMLRSMAYIRKQL
ncbi:hypothetical protein C1H46_041418 [Malus baccata]|uniref:COMM domain-containing protein n=1 Tax=Malus baccata TaxID=106549 RepID=A0A540KFP2_MALBA|nr:hypothetical protein C1H46_041418 [Malus baccata]